MKPEYYKSTDAGGMTTYVRLMKDTKAESTFIQVNDETGAINLFTRYGCYKGLHSYSQTKASIFRCRTGQEPSLEEPDGTPVLMRQSAEPSSEQEFLRVLQVL